MMAKRMINGGRKLIKIITIVICKRRKIHLIKHLNIMIKRFIKIETSQKWSYQQSTYINPRKIDIGPVKSFNFQSNKTTPKHLSNNLPEIIFRNRATVLLKTNHKDINKPYRIKINSQKVLI
jgi:hypothetical protein